MRSIMKIATAILCALFIVLSASAQDSRELADAYEQGRKLNASEAAKLENKLAKKPQDTLDRIRLIAFYTLAPESPAPETAIVARRKHLLWMAEHQPDSRFWSQWPYGSAVYVKGDRLADAEGFNAIRDQWLKHLSSGPANEKIRANAVGFLELGDRETALRLTREMHNPRYLGTQYALLLLGVTARDYDTGIPLFSDPMVRQGPLASEALSELQNSSDAQLIGGAGFWLARDGAILWSQKKLEWDYSSLAKNLLDRARALEPDRLDWFMANPELPQPGERRPIMTVRVGGAVMGSRSLRTVQPNVPDHLRGIRGTVLLEVAIDGNGKVMRAVAKGGPPELYAVSIQAVEQWQYKPTTISGSPALVITSVEINYH
jgi:Gram-negative bacterial TonB protein C-terminal